MMHRREFLLQTGKALAVLAAPGVAIRQRAAASANAASAVTLALCGDVMTGRGIDQILAHPSDPTLHESYVRSALRYVELAEGANGPIPRGVEASYIWGDALADLDQRAPDVRIVNLETAVTRSDDYWPGKGINYRMHPENVSCLSAAGIDCCTLANNHTLDWGRSGLTETLETLERARIGCAGAGRNKQEAEAAVILELSAGHRVVVISVGAATSGIPPDWVATERRPGVSLLASLSETSVSELADRIARVRRPGDVVVVSIHWGSNWGYDIPDRHQWFAHRLIEAAGVDVIHGHSSHHPRGIEVYRERPILYGCGDFLNDYEGIGGYERFRSDLVLLYFVTLEPATGTLTRLEMTPFQIHRFRARRASSEDVTWLRDTMDRIGSPLGTRVATGPGDSLALRWAATRS